MTIRGDQRPCENPRCKADVVDALEIGPTSNKPVVVDPEPTTYAAGGRLRMSSHQPESKPHVVRLRSAAAAFGLASVYTDHKSTCGGGSGVKTRSKEAER